jgi:hypothetical protein
MKMIEWVQNFYMVTQDQLTEIDFVENCPIMSRTLPQVFGLYGIRYVSLVEMVPFLAAGINHLLLS